MFPKIRTNNERGSIMISKKMSEAVNEQLNFELYSSYIYASMASWFKNQNLEGFANWMNVQVKEELDHASRLYDFLHNSGGEVVFAAIPKPQTSWDGVVEVFETTLDHEGQVTTRINNLIDLALDERDHATNARLQWFITEQVEEESNVLAVLQQVKMIKDSPEALILMDRELGSRVYTPSSTE